MTIQPRTTALTCVSFLAILCDVGLTVGGGGTHNVTQAYTFRIQNGGKVNVLMDIEFMIAAGAAISGSYKSILDTSGSKSLEQGSLKVKDMLGRDVATTLQDVNGWLQANFTFPDKVHGHAFPKYTLKIQYTVINGICSSSSLDLRFHFPWAHRWLTPVHRSTYIINFHDSTSAPQSMDKVCLLGTGFVHHCGPSGLAVQSATAEYVTSGSPHGLFFQWPPQSGPPSAFQTCPPCAHCAQAPQITPGTSAGAAGLPPSDHVKASSLQTVLVVLSIILCGVLLAISAFVGRKLKHWTPKTEGNDATLRLTETAPASPPHKKCCEEDDNIPDEQGGGLPLGHCVEVDVTNFSRKAPARVFHQEPKALAGIPFQLQDDSEVPFARSNFDTSFPSPRPIGLPCDTSGITIEIDEDWVGASPRSSSSNSPAPNEVAVAATVACRSANCNAGTSTHAAPKAGSATTSALPLKRANQQTPQQKTTLAPLPSLRARLREPSRPQELRLDTVSGTAPRTTARADPEEFQAEMPRASVPVAALATAKKTPARLDLDTMEVPSDETDDECDEETAQSHSEAEMPHASAPATALAAAKPPARVDLDTMEAPLDETDESDEEFLAALRSELGGATLQPLGIDPQKEALAWLPALLDEEEEDREFTVDMERSIHSRNTC